MLTWHNVWMARHGKEIAGAMVAVGRAVAEGSKPLFALAVVVGVAVLREGSEVVLFLYGVAASDGGSP
jgi:high-affinity iron transporter